MEENEVRVENTEPEQLKLSNDDPQNLEDSDDASKSAKKEAGDEEKSQDKVDKKKKDMLPPTKVVIRRLPPSMNSASFLEQVSPLPDYNSLYFVKADSSYNPHAFSRAYVNFVNFEDVYTFKEKFDNYVFLDSKGGEYMAVVEYAIFQRIPKRGRFGKKRDNKCNSIETDHTYIRFLEEFNQDTDTIGESKPEYSFQIKDDTRKTNAVTSTPLIEFLNRRRQEQMRIREEKREDRRRREQARRRLKDEERRKKRLAAQARGKETLCQKHQKSKEDNDPYLCSSPLQFESDGNGSGENSLTTYEQLRKNSCEKRNSDSDKESKRDDYQRQKPVKKSRFEEKKRGDKPKRSFEEKARFEPKPRDSRVKTKNAPVMKLRFPQSEKGRKDIYASEEKPRFDKSTKTETNLKKTFDKKNVKTENDWRNREKESKLEVKETKKENDEKKNEDGNYETRSTNEEDPRKQRRIRNKDRPALQIYRPGMGRFSKERKTQNEDQSKNNDSGPNDE